VLGAATLTAYLVADVNRHDQSVAAPPPSPCSCSSASPPLVLEAERMQAAGLRGRGWRWPLAGRRLPGDARLRSLRGFFALAVPGLWSVIVIVTVS
jgi:hypothetical protein